MSGISGVGSAGSKSNLNTYESYNVGKDVDQGLDQNWKTDDYQMSDMQELDSESESIANLGGDTDQGVASDVFLEDAGVTVDKDNNTISLDTNGDGNLESFKFDDNSKFEVKDGRLLIDLDGNGKAEVQIRKADDGTQAISVDSQSDGTADSVYVENTDGTTQLMKDRNNDSYLDFDRQTASLGEDGNPVANGEQNMVSTFEDNNFDGGMDRIKMGLDTDGDQKVDFTMVARDRDFDGVIDRQRFTFEDGNGNLITNRFDDDLKKEGVQVDSITTLTGDASSGTYSSMIVSESTGPGGIQFGVDGLPILDNGTTNSASNVDGDNKWENNSLNPDSKWDANTWRPFTGHVKGAAEFDSTIPGTHPS